MSRTACESAPAGGRLGALVGALLALAGCYKAVERPEGVVPAAHASDVERPLEMLPPLELASAEDAIVRIVGDVACTGTLIADDRVLTAHHCVSQRDAQGKALARNKAPKDIHIELGGDYLPWGDVTVRAVVAPDCGYESGHGDIAILVLSRHLVGMPTSNVRIEAAPQLEEGLEVFGFGRCALSPHAIHRSPRTAGKIEAVFPSHVVTNASICPGDSGGPVYLKGRLDNIVGVVSASVMDGDDRTEGLSYFTRVDVWPQLFSAAHEISEGAGPNELPPYGDCGAQRGGAEARRISRGR